MTPNTFSSHLSQGSGGTGRILLLWYFASIFLVFSLTLDDQKFTCAFAVPAAALMFLRNFKRIKKWELILLSMLVILALISAIFGLNEDFIDERIKSWILFTYSISITYAMRLELGRATQSEISWVTGWLLFVILVAAILEALGPLRSLSDAFRAWNNATIYVSYDRDFQLAGFLRPTVLTAEPSFAAVGTAVFSLAWFASTAKRSRLIFFSASTALALFLFRSPISIIPVVPVGIIYLVNFFDSARRPRHTFFLFFAIIVLLACSIVVYRVVTEILEARISAGGHYGDQSLDIRLLAPPKIALQTIIEAPFFGAGIGGRGSILVYIINVFSELNIETTSLTAEIVDTIPNAFWEYWIYFGILGGVLGAIIIYFFWSLIVKDNGFAAAIFVLLLFNSLGAFAAPRIWSYAILVAITLGSTQKNRFIMPASPH